ncbi:CDC27 family protein [Campylobacter curvus]|uniref:CDC27 family protein n=1 Tax=Campylobacter curvus TaxID=200 RepID=UPI0014705E5D|nr:CDC27 family protein [Campylobacter curvus]
MLDTAEIKKLEERYEAYARKHRSIFKRLPSLNKNSKILIAELLAIVALVVVLVLLSIDSPQQKIAITSTPKEQNQTKSAISEVKEKSAQAKIRFEDNKKQDELVDKIAQKIEQTLKTGEQNGSEETSSKPKAQNRQKDGSQQGWLRLNFINSEDGKDFFDERDDTMKSIPLPREEKIMLDPSEPPAKKAKINIEVSSAKDEQSALKEQFIRTNNPAFALDLARINFREQKYQEALKWSLAANEIDNNLEESWVIFAKSKYKLKQKDDALRALREYNKNANKSSIGELIRQIENDAL